MNIPAFDAALNYLERVECMEFGDYIDAFFFAISHSSWVSLPHISILIFLAHKKAKKNNITKNTNNTYF